MLAEPLPTEAEARTAYPLRAKPIVRASNRIEVAETSLVERGRMEGIIGILPEKAALFLAGGCLLAVSGIYFVAVARWVAIGLALGVGLASSVACRHDFPSQAS